MGEDAAGDADDLLGALAFSVDHLRNSRAQHALVVERGKAELLERDRFERLLRFESWQPLASALRVPAR